MKKNKSLVPKWLLKRLDSLKHEEFWLLSVNPHTREVYDTVRLARGSHGTTPLDPPFRMVKLLKFVIGPSPSLVLVHNHPAATAKAYTSTALPSMTDLGYFLWLYKSLKSYIVDVIITHDEDDDFSFRDHKILKCYDYIINTFTLRKYNIKAFQLASYLYFAEFFSVKNAFDLPKILADDPRINYGNNLVHRKKKK